MQVDTLIFGGGAAGLWLLDELTRQGSSAVLLEAAKLGQGQTIASQGIIHGGLKYTLQGLLTPSAAAIRDMFARFMDSSVSMSHEVTGVVVDAKSRRVATEQRYSGTLADGTTNDMCNCNFFDVGPDGRFTRVVIWMGGGSPLK